uniref:C2H2-type domain-containing protein n=1 Tax=Pristionchus pacificus TaxID=54126 RepID=A0A8R1Z4X3_PRIPA
MLHHIQKRWTREVDVWKAKIAKLPIDPLRYLTLDFLELMHTVVKDGPAGEELSKKVTLQAKVLRQAIRMDRQRNSPQRSMYYAIASCMCTMLESIAGRGKEREYCEESKEKSYYEENDEERLQQYPFHGMAEAAGEKEMEPIFRDEGPSEPKVPKMDHAVKEEPLDDEDLSQNGTFGSVPGFVPMPDEDIKEEEVDLLDAIEEEKASAGFVDDNAPCTSSAAARRLPGDYPTQDAEAPPRYLDLLSISDAEMIMMALMSSSVGGLTLGRICSYIEFFFPERVGQCEGHNYRNSISNSISNLNGRLIKSKKVKETLSSLRLVNEYYVLPKVFEEIKKLNQGMGLLASIRRLRNGGAHFTFIRSFENDRSAPYYLQLTQDIIQDESIFSNLPNPLEHRRKRPRTSPDIHICSECGLKVNSEKALSQHSLDCAPVKYPGYEEYICDECGEVEDSAERLKEHIVTKHSGKKISCAFCGLDFRTKHDVDEHNETEEHKAAVLLFLNENA